ncbi:MAG TPA: hypothetical protein VFS90_04710 [Pyrinomonadaceae bacterium]|nr:hypothetical protein [Pyrinomonadaceae bacterium]
MTATRQTTSTPKNEAAPIEPGQEFELPDDSDQMKTTTESLELAEKI